MEKNDHSKTKLLNKNIKVTDKDIYEFNAWIKGKKITPALMKEFDDVTSYEDFMYDYDPTEEYSIPAISLDTAQDYIKGSEGYEYLSSVDQVVYDQIAAELAKHDLKIEYDEHDDVFKVFSAIDNLDLGNSSIDVGEYCNGTDTYKKLSSLDESSFKSLMSNLEGKLNIDYDTPNDKFIVTKVESRIGILDPGSYYRDTKEYKALDKMPEKEWQDYLDEMARYGLSIEYDNITDSFIVIGSDSYSKGREKVSAEMLEKAKTDGVVQKKPNGKWGIISIDAGEWWTPDYDTRENAEAALAAYHANKSERSFTTNEVKFVEVETTNPDKLVKILETIKSHGNIGHTFDIAIDYNDERQEIIQWDGDGSDRIENITINSTNEPLKRTFSYLSSEDTITEPGIYIIYFEETNLYKIIDVKLYNIGSVNSLVKEWPGNFVLYKAENRKDAINYLINNGFIKHGEDWVSDNNESYSMESDNIDKSFSNKLTLDNLSVDDLKGLALLGLANNPRLFDDMRELEYRELVDILQDTAKEYLSDKDFQVKCYEVVHNLLNIANK